jgi:predicted DNA-binding protein
MNKTITYDKAVSLNLPSSLCFEMDEIAEELGMTRTAFLHKSIERYVEFMNDVQLPNIRKQKSLYNRIRNSKWLTA